MGFQITVTWRGRTTEIISSSVNPTLEELGRSLERDLGASFETLKFLVPGRKGQISPCQNPAQHALEAGLHPGAKVLLLASKAEEVVQVRAAHDLPGLRSFDDELKLAARRRRTAAVVQPPKGEYTFKTYETWQRAGLQPPPSEALKLLYRLAADPGIRGVMDSHRYRVGLLSEMPPEGKVGVSPVCILGVNVNAGQEISLRLRTDDLKGFRKYERIRETLIHELAHMEFGEHDDNFKQLNSQLGRECAAINARYATAHSLLGATQLSGAQTDDHVRPSELDAVDDDSVMAVTARTSGRTLRQLAGMPGSSAGNAASGGPVSAGGVLLPAAAGAAVVSARSLAAHIPRALAASAAILRSQAATADETHQQQQPQQPLELVSGRAAVSGHGGTGQDVAPSPQVQSGEALRCDGRDEEGGTEPMEVEAGMGGSSSGDDANTADDRGRGRDVAREYEHYDAATEAAEAAARQLGSLDDRPASTTAASTASRANAGGEAANNETRLAVGGAEDANGVKGGAAAPEGLGGGGLPAPAPVSEVSQAVGLSSGAAATAPANEGQLSAASTSTPMEVDGAATPRPTPLAAVVAPPPPLLIRLTLHLPPDLNDGGAATGVGDASVAEVVVQDKLRQAWIAAAKLVAAVSAPGARTGAATGASAAAASNTAGGGLAVTADDVAMALETLETLLGNAAQLPGEERYRRVRLVNAAFQRRVGRLPGGLELLRVAGFCEEGLGQEAVMRLRRNDPGLLWLVLSVVREARQQVAGQVAAQGAAGRVTDGGVATAEC